MTVDALATEVLVLAYHRIGDAPPGRWNDWFYVPDEAFAEQLRLLAEGDWTVVDLRQFMTALEDPTAAPARSALITFDDADETLLTGALPRLVDRQFPAVAFVPTGFVGTTNSFDADYQPPERICGWDELNELTRHGVSIQAHSVSHRWFANLGAQDIRRELQGCKEAIEDRLGHAPEAFAYPYGDMGRQPARTEQILAELGYRLAFLYGGNCPSPIASCRRYRLARLAIGRDTDLAAELANPMLPSP